MKTHLLLLITLLSVGIFSCKKEKIIEVERQTAWKKVGGYDFDYKVNTNSAVVGDHLYISGKYSSLIGVGQTSSNTFILGPYDFYADRKYPIGKNYVMGVDDFGGIYLSNIQSPFYYFYLTTRIYDLSYNNLNHYDESFAPNPSGVINEQDDLLTFYKTSDLKIRILFLSVKPDPFGYVVDTFFTKKIDIPNQNVGSRPIMFPYEDCFLISFGDAIYKILPDGSYSKKFDNAFPRQYFSKGDSIYAVASNYIYFSSDKGETWQAKFNSSLQTSFINVYKTNGKFIGSYNGQLFDIQIKNSGIDYVELVNDGLETSVINSVTYFDHKYFITTNSGVFYRSEGDFLSYK